MIFVKKLPDLGTFGLLLHAEPRYCKNDSVKCYFASIIIHNFKISEIIQQFLKMAYVCLITTQNFRVARPDWSAVAKHGCKRGQNLAKFTAEEFSLFNNNRPIG